MTVPFLPMRAVSTILSSALNKHAKLILLVLVKSTNRDTGSTGRPPAKFVARVEWIAAQASVVRSTVKAQLRLLERDGYVRTQRHYSSHYERTCLPNSYEIVLERFAPQIANTARRTPPPTPSIGAVLGPRQVVAAVAAVATETRRPRRRA